MATVQATDGSSAVTSSSTNNDNGTIVNAGNTAADGPITNVIRVDELADDKGESTGSKVVANDGTGDAETDRVGVAKAVSGGTLAFEANATQWIMKGGNVSTTIGGVANTVLAGGGSDYNGAFSTRDNINEINSTRVLGVGTFNALATPSTQITPNFTKGGTAGNAQNFVQADDGSTAASDNAAVPTRAVPGELTYNFGAPNPTTDEYKAKDEKES
tara:strand:- start:25106 stop:25753 length:648 start_codon:yes stop_codon:yes gene_type:complete